jgi:hypothetical protein
MRRIATLLAVAALGGCGGDEGGGDSGASSNAKKEKGGRSLTGCLKLWEGPHVGSTRMKYVAARQPIYAKVEVRGGKCRVSFASRDGKVYGRYIEKPNVTGAWTKDAESAPAKTALKVVASANATGEADGGLKAGAP